MRTITIAMGTLFLVLVWHPSLAFERLASLTIHVVDDYGRPVQYRVQHFQRIDSDKPSKELSGLFRNGSAANIPLGNYEYRMDPIDGTTYKTLTARVLLTEPGPTWVTQMAAINYTQDDSLQPPETNIGNVVGIDPRLQPTWVQLLDAFRGHSVEEAPIIKGRFRLLRWHFGKFIIAVHAGTEIVHLQVIELHSTLPPDFRIDVSQRGAEAKGQ